MTESNDISNFRKNYCLLKETKRTKEIIGSPSKFARFYYELASAMDLPKERCLEFAKLVADIDKVYAALDSLVDSELVPEQRIRRVQIVENGYELVYRLKQMELSYAPIKKAFEDGIRLFEKERAMASGEIRFSETKLEKMLISANCDFQSITSLFLQYLPTEQIAQGKTFSKFMGGYEKSDLIFDHLVDIDEDSENNDYNMVLWRRQSINEPMSVTYDFFVKRALGSIEETQRTLDQDTKLNRQLQFYLDGQREGLRIYSNMEFLIGHEHKAELEGLLLKPHPWENGQY